jgi:2-phospho-L-lactate transferase/gluconeogenesis factor (CofD/UPF0052 family)
VSHVGAIVAAVTLAGPLAAGAAEVAVVELPPAPMERVWRATEAALRELGWGIDHADRTIGVLVTESHRLAGDDEGIQARTRRLRLRVRLVPATERETRVVIERELFDRERVLWVEKDDPIVLRDALGPDPGLERRLVAAIRKAL